MPRNNITSTISNNNNNNNSSSNNKMTPPSRTSASPSASASASELADRLEDYKFFISSPSPSTSTSDVPSISTSHAASRSRQLKKSTGSSSGSLSNSSSISNISNFSYGEDFTLGARTANSNLSHSTSTIVSRPHQYQYQHQHQHQHQHQNRTSSYTYYTSTRPSSSKERYVFSNFRFLIKDSCPFPGSVDDSIDWHSIEMVLVPEIENVLCPICLDVPCTPRFTRCGHIYCLPCLLQFFQSSEPSSNGNNWRTCPVCNEPLHLKQLRPVKFCPATEPHENEIFHSVLVEKAVNSLRPHLPRFPNDSLTQISPFQRLIPVSRSFVLNEIITPDINLLRSEIKTRRSCGEESLELSFYEAAIKVLEDQRKQISVTNDNKSPETITSTSSVTGNVDYYYFHQSRDGLNVFLHPLCMKILKHHFVTYTAIPCNLSLPILQLERVLVSSSNRKRFKYLDHLSLGTQIILVEVDLGSIVSASTLQFHSKELANRRDARDQKLAQSALTPKEGSILDEWKRMEDDYYSTAQVSAAMDIKVPETIKLDNLDDEASFPLPSSFNEKSFGGSIGGGSAVGGSLSIKPGSFRKSTTIGSSVGSPSFSALADSLNSPFSYTTHNHNHNFTTHDNTTNSTLFESTTSTPPKWVQDLTTSSSIELSPATTNTSTTTTTTSSSKKKILLFSSGLNVKQR